VTAVVAYLCKIPPVLKMFTPTTEELKRSAVSEEKVCNSRAIFISHTISLGWVGSM
jgi:hypothetical protein